MRKHALAEMTWVEFRERLAERPVVLLPFASQEEQGPHAPMGDYLLTERLALRAAAAADAVVAPIMPFGFADFFRAVPGGISLKAETFKAVLADICENFLDHEIEHLVVFNGHSSNAPLIDQATRALKRARGVFVPAIHIWQIMPAGLIPPEARGHGGDPLTSVYLHMLPELMRPDLIESGPRKPAFGLPTTGVGGVQFDGQAVNLPLDVDQVTDTGVIAGDPRLATAERGRRIADFVVDFTARFVRHWKGCDPREPGSEG